MRVRVLGDFEVTHGGQPVKLGGPKQRSLLAVLVAAAGRPVSVERLIDQLWGDDPPPKVLQSLQAFVARLRRALEPQRLAREQAQVLVTRASGYALDLPDGAVDAPCFERLVAAAQRTTTAAPVEAERLLVDALDLWGGAAYGGVSGCPVLEAERLRLEELRVAAVEQLWSTRIELGAYADAVAALGPLTTDHPLRERLWGLLVLALYRMGRQAEALETLGRVRKLLVEELGLDPGPELRQLEVAVLRQDAGLLPGLVEPPSDSDPPRPRPNRSVPDGIATMQGRAAALARTAELVAEAASGRGRVVLVTGEPGIGKSRFAAAVAAQAEAAGLPSGTGTWEAEGCPPFWGWSEALRPLTGASGTLLRPGEEQDAASTAFRLAEEIIEALAASGACLVLDDVQWADPDSHRLLGRLAHLVGRVPVLLVVCCREPLADATLETQASLATVARTNPARVALTGLETSEVADLVRARTGLQMGDALAHRVRDRTDGNPFFINELVRLLVETGELTSTDAAPWRSVPAGVRDVVRHRLNELLPTVGMVLSSAAVLGRTFDLDVLEASWDGDVAAFDDALESAVAAGLVVEEPDHRYRFAHALVRDAVYNDIAPPTRRRAHARAAVALEHRRSGRLDDHAPQLAEHYRLAGPAHARSAWIFAARAARLASERGSHGEAAQLLGSAADLQRDDHLAEDGEREQVMGAYGRELQRSAQLTEAWRPLATAARAALARDDPAAAAGHLLAVTERAVWGWRPSPEVDETAVKLWQEVIGTLPRSEVALRARAQTALAAEMLHDPPGVFRGGPLVDEAIDTARRLEDKAVLTSVLLLAEIALGQPDQLHRRLTVTDELLRLCERRHDEPSLAITLWYSAAGHADLGRWNIAQEHLQRSHTLAERHHMAPVLMVTNLSRAAFQQAAGNFEAAEATLTTVESIQATISMIGTGITLTQLATIRLAQGRISEVEPSLRTVRDFHPALRELHALALTADGRLDEARDLLGPWSTQPPLPWDYLWVAASAARAHVWAALDDQPAVHALRQDLLPFQNRVAGGASFFLGSVHHALARLAFTAGDHLDADRHARLGLALEEQLGCAPWAARTSGLLEEITASKP